jgi:hypothetical protein
MEPAAPITCEEEFQQWLVKTLERERRLLAADPRGRETAATTDLGGKYSAGCEGDRA